MSFYNIFKNGATRDMPLLSLGLGDDLQALTFQKNLGLDPTYPNAPVAQNITFVDAQASGQAYDIAVSGNRFLIPAYPFSNPLTDPYYFLAGLTPINPASGDPTKFLNQVGQWVVNGVGGGDVSSNVTTSVVGDIALFADTTGKLITDIVTDAQLLVSGTVTLQPMGNLELTSNGANVELLNGQVNGHINIGDTTNTSQINCLSEGSFNLNAVNGGVVIQSQANRVEIYSGTGDTLVHGIRDQIISSTNFGNVVVGDSLTNNFNVGVVNQINLHCNNDMTIACDAGGSIGVGGASTTNFVLNCTNELLLSCSTYSLLTSPVSVNLLNNGAGAGAGSIAIGDGYSTGSIALNSQNYLTLSSASNAYQIQSVAYNMPTSNASGVLTNNGSGGLSWAPSSPFTFTQPYQLLASDGSNNPIQIGGIQNDGSWIYSITGRNTSDLYINSDPSYGIIMTAAQLLTLTSTSAGIRLNSLNSDLEINSQNTGNVATFSYNASLVSYIDSTGAYIPISLRKYKNTIGDIGPNILDKVCSLKPRLYKLNNDKSDKLHPGFIHDEIPDGFHGIKCENGVNYTGLIPYIVKAIKELNLHVQNNASNDIDELKSSLKIDAEDFKAEFMDGLESQIKNLQQENALLKNEVNNLKNDVDSIKKMLLKKSK